jgi:hypothetical protein
MINRRFAGLASGVLAVAMATGSAEAQPQAPGRVPISVLERYVGEYDQDGNTIKVLLQGNMLIREIPGQRVVLEPISETMFHMGPVFTAEFVTDESGAVTLVFSDGIDIEYRLPRKGSRPSPPSPPAVAAVRVPRSVLERYVGTYEYIPGQMSRTDLRVVIRLKGNTLIREMGRDVVLTPISNTQFRVGNTRMTVEFVVDEAGVTQVMGSGFQQMLARLEKR